MKCAVEVIFAFALALPQPKRITFSHFASASLYNMNRGIRKRVPKRRWINN